METELWCRMFILSTCVHCSIMFHHTKITDYAVITINHNISMIATKTTALATTLPSYRRSRWQQHKRKNYIATNTQITNKDDKLDKQVIDHFNSKSNTKAIGQSKIDYWDDYYDFLINEGSFKFWAVFQLATAVLLIYSGFVALYYAKVNQITEDYDDFLLKRRQRFVNGGQQPGELPYFGFEPQSFQRILDAVATQMH